MIKNHKADSFEGSRAASLIEPEDPSVELDPPNISELSLSGFVQTRAKSSEDEDARALLLAIMALSGGYD